MPGTRDVELPKEWFEEVFGVPEGKYKEMRDDFEAAAGLLICKSTGKMFQAGTLRTPTLSELKTQLDNARQDGDGGYYNAGVLRFTNLTSDTLSLYQIPKMPGLFSRCAHYSIAWKLLMAIIPRMASLTTPPRPRKGRFRPLPVPQRRFLGITLSTLLVRAQVADPLTC